jgi:hypothetical protein
VLHSKSQPCKMLARSRRIIRRQCQAPSG